MLPSAKFLVDSITNRGLEWAKTLKALPSNKKRRLFFKISVNSFEELVKREDDGLKTCLSCFENIVGDIAAHCILHCPCIPRKYVEKQWFQNALNNDFGEEPCFRSFLLKFLSSNECNHLVLKALFPKTTE